jgi:SfnB family sulfur acquisition oxidoreductase
VAKRLAGLISAEASLRDRTRRLPVAEIELLSESGLLAITVPKAFGGAGVSNVTLAQVTAILAAADGSIGQIPQNHFYMVEALRLNGTPAQQAFFFDRVLQGDRFGNAYSETGTKTVAEFKTRLTRDGEGYRLNGRKSYSTGALFAQWIAVVANNDDNKVAVAFLDRETPGLSLIDDWDSFGQRTTGSGTTILDNVEVPSSSVVPHHLSYDRPTSMGPVAQIIHAGVDLGIAKAALAETIAFVRSYTRPWMDSGQDYGYEDPYLISQVGDVDLRIEAADAALERAGHFVDTAAATPNDRSVAEASVAVAEARILTTEAALLATNKLFELSGTRSTLNTYNLDRHWRNARTHTLHDPVRWKFRHVGNFWLNDVLPPRNGAI